MLHRNTSLPLLVSLFLSLSIATSTNYIATETTYTTNLCNPNNIISSYEHSTNCTPYDGTDNKYSLRLTCKIETNEVEMIVFHGISCQGDPLIAPKLFALDTCIASSSADVFSKWTCTTINDVSLSSTEESVAPTPTSTPTPATFSTAPSPTPPTQTAPSTQTLIPVPAPAPAPAPATTTTSATTTTTPQPQKTLSATTTVSPFLSSSSSNSNTTTNTNTMALNPGDETILDTSDAYSDEHISSKIVAVLLLCWVINLCIES